MRLFADRAALGNNRWVTVTKVRLNTRANAELGQRGINLMCRHLYARDCQTCGRSLGVRSPAITVDDYRTYIQAQLHHERCARPRWTERSHVVLDFSGPAHLTYHAIHLMSRYPLFPGLEPNTVLVVMNTGLEAVTMARQDGDWQVTTVDRYIGHGLQAAVRTQPVRPVAGSRLSIRDTSDGSDPSMVIQLRSGHSWRLSMEHFMATAARRMRGIVLLVTSAVDPFTLRQGEFLSRELCGLIDSGHCAVGWTPLDPSRA